MCSRRSPTFEFVSCHLVICQSNDNEKCILLMRCAAMRGALLHAEGRLKLCCCKMSANFLPLHTRQCKLSALFASTRRNLVESYFLFFKARGW